MLTNKYYKKLVPKTIPGLLKFRNRLIGECAKSSEIRAAVWEMCQDDMLFYVNCVSEGTLVVTDRGLVAIENVSPSDKVWDGDSWVSQDGHLYQGHKPVIFRYGIYLTPDHKVWTDHGWQNANEGYDRAEVWLPDGYSQRWNLQKNERGSVVVPVQVREHNDGTRKLSPELYDAELRVPEGGSGETRSFRGADSQHLVVDASEVPQQEQHWISPIRRQRDQGVCSVAEIRELSQRHGRETGRHDDRTDRQQRKLREVELQVGVSARASEQHSQEPRDSDFTWTDDDCSTRTPPGSHPPDDAEAYSTGPYRGQVVDPPLSTAVYDLVNCGPKRAFTVIDCNGLPLLVKNCFGWLQEPRSVSGKREIPFCTRDYQDKVLLQMQKTVESGDRDIGIEKSREVGATWMVLYLADWYWRFHPQSHIGLTSRNMDTVDNAEDPDSLMGKLDYLQSKLPNWLAGHEHRSRILNSHSIRNKRNGSTIIGYPSTESAGRGGRKLFIVMDELHFYPAGDDYAVMGSTQYATNCRIVISTPNKRSGESGAYYDFITDPNSKFEKIVIDWKDDAAKRAGLYTSDKHGRLEILDKHHAFPADYPYILDGMVRSPYFDSEWNRPLATPQSIAAELNRNFSGATYRFIPDKTLERAKTTVMDPFTRGWINVDPSDCDLEFNAVSNGPFLLWVSLAGDRPPPGTYCIGFDIATGVGGAMSSNSALVVFNLKTGEQVAEFADKDIDPNDFAVMGVGVCKWFYDAKMIPEINGVGGIYMKRVLSLRYHNIYRRKMKDVPFRKVQDKIGYTNQDGGLELLGGLQVGIDTQRCIIRSERIVKELGQYIYIDGNLKHVGERGTDIDSAKGKAHGDIAIAAGCAWHGVTDVTVVREEIPEAHIPAGCFLDRRNKSRELERHANSGLWCP